MDFHSTGTTWPAQWYTEPAEGYALHISAILYDTKIVNIDEMIQPHAIATDPPVCNPNVYKENNPPRTPTSNRNVT